MGRIRANVHPPKKCNVLQIPSVDTQTTPRETMEQFYSALRSLAEHCQLADLEDELLRDIFTANMIVQEIQKELLKTTLSPEKALELAVSIELGIRSQLAIQAKQPLDALATPFIR